MLETVHPKNYARKVLRALSAANGIYLPEALPPEP